MALTKSSIALSLMVMTLLCGISLAVEHRVGDAPGWTRPPTPDSYAKWAASKNFLVGDTLVFEYNTTMHNVMEVSVRDFKSCNTSSSIAFYKSGNDKITLKRPGHYFFICATPGHCQGGHKVSVRATWAKTGHKSGFSSKWKNSSKKTGSTKSSEAHHKKH